MKYLRTVYMQAGTTVHYTCRQGLTTNEANRKSGVKWCQLAAEEANKQYIMFWLSRTTFASGGPIISECTIKVYAQRKVKLAVFWIIVGPTLDRVAIRDPSGMQVLVHHPGVVWLYTYKSGARRMVSIFCLPILTNFYSRL